MLRVCKNIVIDYTLLFSAAFCLIFARVDVYYVLLAAILHELAHFGASYIAGVTPGDFVLRGFGIELCRREGYSPAALVFTALCGPLCNFALACLGYCVKNYPFFAVNMAVAAVNFLPAMPLDGGQVVYGVVSKYCGRRTAKKTVKILSIATGAAVTAVGAYLLCISGYNFSLMLIGVFILISVSDGGYNPVTEIMTAPQRDMYKCDIFVLDDNMKLMEAANVLPKNSMAAVRDKDGKIYNYITPEFIYENLSGCSGDTLKEFLENKRV